MAEHRKTKLNWGNIAVYKNMYNGAERTIGKRLNVKTYVIMVNNKHAANMAACSSSEAINAYCNSVGARIFRRGNMGNCGIMHIYCRKAPNGLFQCGSIRKCKAKMVVQSSMGIMLAQQIGNSMW